MDCNCTNFFTKLRKQSMKELNEKFITFSPPKQSLYSLEDEDKEKTVVRKKPEKHTAITKKYKFVYKKQEINIYKWISSSCFKIRKKNNKAIVVLYIQNNK